MARKKKPEEHENHERWLVSYADFITLLFAFFVVMYALSTVNEGKYKVLSESLINAFRSNPRSLKPIQMGDPISAPQDIFQDIRPDPQVVQAIRLPIEQQRQENQAGGKAAELDKENMKRIANKLEKALGRMIEKDLITVRRSEKWIEVEINNSVLFNSGSALLQPKAIPILVEIARILRNHPNAIRVEGFTDNVPIETQIYPSNWELSAGRAASVVHLFSDEGVGPFQLSATGFGEYRPIAANSTAEGRRRNRRILIVIMSESAADIYDLSKLKTVKEDKRLSRDVNLDALPELETLVEPTTDLDSPLPDGLPGGLPLNARKIVPTTQQSQDRLLNIMEDISNKENGQDGRSDNTRGAQ